MSGEHEHATLLEVPALGLGRADHCAVGGKLAHWPPPARFVWHHILPQVCGGRTVPGNLIALCDSCHYATHALLFWLAGHEGGDINEHNPFAAAAVPDRRRFARLGYARALEAGTVHLIPNEGSVIG